MSVAGTDPDSCWLLSNVSRQKKWNPGCPLKGILDFCVETGTSHSHHHVDDVDGNLFLGKASPSCFKYTSKTKGKAHPLQAMQAQRGLGELGLLDFLTKALYGGRLSALRTDHLYPQGYSWYLFFTRGWVDPRAMVLSEGNMSLKNPVTPPGIDPGTVRLVAQRLNHYATPGPTVKTAGKDEKRNEGLKKGEFLWKFKFSGKLTLCHRVNTALLYPPGEVTTMPLKVGNYLPIEILSSVQIAGRLWEPPLSKTFCVIQHDFDTRNWRHLNRSTFY